MIARALETKKLLVPDILDPKIQKAHIANSRVIMNRSLSKIIKLLPKIESVDEISRDIGPNGNTLSILKVNAINARSALIPPPIVKESKRLDRIINNKKEINSGKRIQMTGAIIRFHLPAVG